MSDVLSQNEIDNLLSALSSGEFNPADTEAVDERQKSILEHLYLYLSIMPGYCLPTFRCI